MNQQNNENCPYTLAVELGVQVTSNPIDTGDMVAWYMTTGRSTYRIYTNPSVELYDQEKAIFILLKHHQESKGLERYITKSDLRIVNKIIRRFRKMEDMAANIFLKGSIFNK